MDLKFALRSLFKSPGFTLLAIVVMTPGIGANTAVFSVVNAVLLKPLAYPEPDRIVTPSSLWKNNGSQATVSAPDFHDWHDQSSASRQWRATQRRARISPRTGAGYGE